jgi:hypothetical protein
MELFTKLYGFLEDLTSLKSIQSNPTIMVLKFIDEEIRALGLEPVQLNALRPDDVAYSILLNQYKGEAVANKDFIGNSQGTHDLAVKKCVQFSEIAVSNAYDLAVSPEYSTPWKAISKIISSKVLPVNGKLWIFGAETIKPSELVSFIKDHKDIIWIYDKKFVEGKHDKTFFDPVCYFFKALQGKKEFDVCVIQFKNQHMSVHSNIYREEDFLIEGQQLYVLRNNGSTTYMVTMICSDSLKFNYHSFLHLNLDRLLVVHIQLNMSPRHDSFKEYRNAFFSGESKQVEVICLNWAKGSKIMGSTIPFSCSAYYSRAEDPILTDDRLDFNQSNGLYYCYWKEKRCHAFFFSSEEYLLGFNTSKTSQALVQAGALRRREGPHCVENLVWNRDKYSKVNAFPDSFKAHCDGLKCDLSPLDALGHVNRERLVKLSNGVNLSKDWFKVQSFDFFSINDSEVINRITFTDEVTASSSQTRRNNLMNLKELIRTYNAPTNVPAQLAVLVTNAKIHYDKSNPFTNIYTNDNTPLGTIAYLGSSMLNIAKEEFDTLVTLFLDSFTPEDKARSKPNILIWYIHDTQLTPYFAENTDIDSDFTENGIAIDKDN